MFSLSIPWAAKISLWGHLGNMQSLQS